MELEQKLDIYRYLVENGTNQKEAEELTDFKALNQDKIQRVEKRILYSVSIPYNKLLKQIPTFEGFTDKEKSKILWLLGFDTKKYQYCIDVQCYTEGNRVECGKVLYGQERLDEEWLKARDSNGCRLASEDAIWHRDRDILEVMKGNKKQ